MWPKLPRRRTEIHVLRARNDRSSRYTEPVETLPHYLRTGLRVVFNILSSPQEALSRRFSELEGSRRFEGIGFERDARGIPILDDVLAWLQCEIVSYCEGGDHGIFIARVDDATWDELRPLLYYRGGYAQLER